MAKPKLGSGARFSALEAKLAEHGAHDPAALAASIGRKKYGKQRFSKLAARARRTADATPQQDSSGF